MACRKYVYGWHGSNGSAKDIVLSRQQASHIGFDARAANKPQDVVFGPITTWERSDGLKGAL